MNTIIQIPNPEGKTLQRLMDIWEGAVRATHDFLGPGEVERLRPLVHEALSGATALYCCGQGSHIDGFIQVEDGKIEMLFVDAAARGKGVGRQLIGYAIRELGARTVDVNEQNHQGIGFYERMGFRRLGRSSHDGQGKPYPLLHMALPV